MPHEKVTRRHKGTATRIPPAYYPTGYARLPVAFSCPNRAYYQPFDFIELD